MDRAVDEVNFTATPNYYMEWIEGGALIANPPWTDDTISGAYGAGTQATAEKGRLWLECRDRREDRPRARDHRAAAATGRTTRRRVDVGRVAKDRQRTMKFPDHFSQQASDYARYRPLYPAKLYEYLASLTPEHDRAWDVGTGNGQAAIGLARHFRSIIATDPSEQQIALATPHERVTYRVATAEHSEIEDRSIDLVAASLAVHWFDLDRFYAEVKRVLKPEVCSPCGPTTSPGSRPKSMP